MYLDTGKTLSNCANCAQEITLINGSWLHPNFSRECTIRPVATPTFIRFGYSHKQSYETSRTSHTGRTVFNNGTSNYYVNKDGSITEVVNPKDVDS